MAMGRCSRVLVAVGLLGVTGCGVEDATTPTPGGALSRQQCHYCTYPMTVEETELWENTAFNLMLVGGYCETAGAAMLTGDVRVAGTSHYPWWDNGQWWIGSSQASGDIWYARYDVNANPYAMEVIMDTMIHEALHVTNWGSWTEQDVQDATSVCMAAIS